MARNVERTRTAQNRPALGHVLYEYIEAFPEVLVRMAIGRNELLVGLPGPGQALFLE